MGWSMTTHRRRKRKKLGLCVKCESVKSVKGVRKNFDEDEKVRGRTPWLGRGIGTWGPSKIFLTPFPFQRVGVDAVGGRGHRV